MAPRDRYHLNAPGDFFVENGMCIICLAPEHEAPELMGIFENSSEGHGASHCYFARQPETPEETEHAIRAMHVACCDALHYGGSDPKILARLRELRSRDR